MSMMSMMMMMMMMILMLMMMMILMMSMMMSMMMMMMMMSMIVVPYPCIDIPSDLFRFVGAEYNSTLHNNLRTTAIYLFGGQSG
jgi:hypothetical protein